MSVGSNLQEMENVVTKGAAAAEPMPKLTTGIPAGQTGNWEDLGGPTPENYTVEVPHKEGKKEKGEKKEGKGHEKDEDEEGEMKKEEYDIEEDVNALLEGEELSEEFQEKARVIFETAINAKVAEIKESLQSSYEQALVEEIEAIKESLVDRVDAYLEYVADEWISENAIAIEHGLKTEMTESFLQGMKSLFEDHYVTIPEDRYDVIESMVDKLDEMEGKLNEQIEKNVALNRRLAESVSDVIFATVAEGLALSQKDKLASLAENVEFDSEDNYREKLVTLRESYFPTKAPSAQRDVTENLSEEANYSEAPQVSGRMESYLSLLSKFSNK